MILCAKHWREILMVQHFISGVIFFLMIEMAFNWGYWDNYNKSDAPCMFVSQCQVLQHMGRQAHTSVLTFTPLSLRCIAFSHTLACDNLHPELWP